MIILGGKMKRILKSRIFFFILGAMIFGTVGVYALTVASKDVTYNNTNVESAINDLYSKVENSKPTKTQTVTQTISQNTFVTFTFSNLSEIVGITSITAYGTTGYAANGFYIQNIIDNKIECKVQRNDGSYTPFSVTLTAIGY